MKFPDAHRGVKKIFTSEILGLIAAVTTIVLGVILIIQSGGNVDNLKIDGSALLLLITSLAIVVILVVSEILLIVGLANAAKDENCFSVALAATVINLIATILQGVFTNSDNIQLKTIFSGVSNVCKLVAVIFIVFGIVTLAAELDDEHMVAKGGRILWIVVILQILSLTASIVSTAYNTSDAAKVIVAIMVLAAGVLDMVKYIFYLSYLKKAVTMLEK